MLRVRSLEQTRTKMEDLFANAAVAKRDVEHVYGAIFVAACASFEAMIEDLFLKLLTGQVRVPRSVKVKATFRSDLAARDVVFGDRKYLDWIPYDRTIKRAESLFYGGRPFSKLGNNEKVVIKEAFLIRNAIAHKEGHARRQFDVEVANKRVLRPRDRTPTSFLRSLHSTGPDVTQYEQFIGELTSIARNLAR
jgi:hypothetical protein